MKTEADLAKHLDHYIDPTHPDFDIEFVARMEATSRRPFDRAAWLAGCTGGWSGCEPWCACHAYAALRRKVMRLLPPEMATGVREMAAHEGVSVDAMLSIFEAIAAHPAFEPATLLEVELIAAARAAA